ncbi:aromatic/alkene monooxygenase hydroxylase subunit beta [Oceanisphaera sediminis]|uniref:Aromatic/alkene monooxygenase hydroxylase subunit beta n=1 Tax=Oceanisphaera sediminis TaxID=981381 RepID=A0ABP7DCT7_9GAMM
MTLEIKTAGIEPIRQTFANISRRFGEKPASRYQEATYDVQGEANFHYRPLWDQKKQLNDKSRTVIEMADWYSFRDPRQFYYGAYVQQRARMQEGAENNYTFFEKRELAANLSDELKSKLTRFLLPLRHVEQTANLNHMFGADYGYGTAITQALLFAGMDRLGMAQYLSRIGLLLDGNSADSLAQAKEYWMTDPAWQGLRALCEETLVTKDWFELFIAQNLVLDTLLNDVVYRQFDTWLVANGGRDIGLLTEFMKECNKDLGRWSDSAFKIAAAESESNRQQLQQWTEKWRGKVADALSPLVRDMLGDDALQDALNALDKRIAKAGISQ